MMQINKLNSKYFLIVKNFALFLATGSLAAIANMISRYFLNFYMSFELAVVIAYVIGMIIAFLLFQSFIFEEPETSINTRVFRFCVVNAVGILLAVLVSTLMARIFLPLIGWTYHPFEFAHFLGVAVPAFSSYFGHKYYTYR